MPVLRIDAPLVKEACAVNHGNIVASFYRTNKLSLQGQGVYIDLGDYIQSTNIDNYTSFAGAVSFSSPDHENRIAERRGLIGLVHTVLIMKLVEGFINNLFCLITQRVYSRCLRGLILPVGPQGYSHPFV